MKRIVFILLVMLLVGSTTMMAQLVPNSAKVEAGIARARSLYVNDHLYREAFEMLWDIDKSINSSPRSSHDKAALHYLVSKERMQIYMRIKRGASAKEHLDVMESLANASNNEQVKNDLLYTKAIYYYTFGQSDMGNAIFKQMADKLTAEKNYDKIDEVYRTLIANSRKSKNANMVAQSYSNYMAWKDSTSSIRHADEIEALKKQIADQQTSIAEKDSSLSTRQYVIIGLSVLAVALAALLVVGALILTRYMMLTRKQKKSISQLQESNGLKAQFIHNISAQLSPTLQKLDGNKPEVKALQDFAEHIQTLSNLESSSQETLTSVDTLVPKYCDDMIETIRDKVKPNVTLKVEAPKISVKFNKDYVSYILEHLLQNAAEYTPEGGTISLEYKKRGAHSHQFLVTDTGCGIPEDQQENVFKPFLEIKDLTNGDGLGLPICKQMALKMNGDLSIDSSYTKGTRFVLNLH